MRNIIDKVTDLFGRRSAGSVKPVAQSDMHVVMPDSVELPLPRSPREEMSIPASINGRDLSTGRL
jgi:hypothetical protein